MALKMSDGFSRLIPSSVVVGGYLLSFWFLAMILARGMNLGIVYAAWSAIGVALIVLIDVLWFDERLTSIQTAGLLAVVAGVAALELGGASGDRRPRSTAGRPGRTGPRRADRRHACTVIEREGIGRVTHRNVTRVAGLPATSAAYHFDTINDLLEAALLLGRRAEQARPRRDRDGRRPDPGAGHLAGRGLPARPGPLPGGVRAVPLRGPHTRAQVFGRERWMTDLAELVREWTDDPVVVTTICAYVDGRCPARARDGHPARPDPARRHDPRHGCPVRLYLPAHGLRRRRSLDEPPR